ncbi:hypothetical protein R3P38DRAFT_2792045 [Favolaschia claudopus]|uniref:Uncharacterized protein n=1 Tax=Favolaschia claudopus TaxID=2862362 RepID=A0AAW0AGE7_9AGAR
MVNPYVDWIWSQYSTPKSSKQLSLQDSCSYFIKYILQPTDIILSHGGFVLHPDLTLPLTNIVSGLDYFLDLASQHRRLQQPHSIGHVELSTLAATGRKPVTATQNQIIFSWVLLLDRIWTAECWLEALCAGNLTHSSLRREGSIVGSVAAALPPVLRSKLPPDLAKGFDIQVTLRKTKAAAGSKTLHAPVVPRSAPADISPASPLPNYPPPATSDELAAQWAHLIKKPLDSSWTIKRGNGQCSLRTDLLSIIMDGVERMQTALADIFRPSLVQPVCFQVDPHGHLEQVLGGTDTLDSFAVAWDTLTERMRQASNTFQECQRKNQEEHQSLLDACIAPDISGATSAVLVREVAKADATRINLDGELTSAYVSDGGNREYLLAWNEHGNDGDGLKHEWSSAESTLLRLDDPLTQGLPQHFGLSTVSSPTPPPLGKVAVAKFGRRDDCPSARSQANVVPDEQEDTLDSGTRINIESTAHSAPASLNPAELAGLGLQTTMLETSSLVPRANAESLGRHLRLSLLLVPSTEMQSNAGITVKVYLDVSGIRRQRSPAHLLTISYAALLLDLMALRLQRGSEAEARSHLFARRRRRYVSLRLGLSWRQLSSKSRNLERRGRQRFQKRMRQTDVYWTMRVSCGLVQGGE